MTSLTRFDTAKVVKGSMQDIARQTGQSIADVFMGAKRIVAVDTSSSMEEVDAKGGTMSRHDAAAFELEQVQNRFPGAVGVVSWSNDVIVCPTGVPIRQNNGTDLATALRFLKQFDGVVDLIIISDGEPNDEVGALAEAKGFTSKIDVVYVGPDGDGGAGFRFMRQLAAAGGGQAINDPSGNDLGITVERLMLGAG